MLFQIGKTYKFNTISNTVLKPEYKQLKAVSVLGFRQAVKYSGVFNDVVTIRRRLIDETGYNLMDSKEAMYYMLEDEHGIEYLFAEDWIKPDTIYALENIDLVITIHNISNDDAPVLLDTLRALGFTNITSKKVEA